MRPEDAIQVQEQWLHGPMLLRQAFHGTAESFVDYVQCVLECLLLGRVANRGQNQALPIGEPVPRIISFLSAPQMESIAAHPR